MDGDVSLRKLKLFLSQHRFLDDDCTNIVLNDLGYLAGNNSELNIDQLSSYIRNMLEGFER